MKTAWIVPFEDVHIRDPLTFELLPQGGALKEINKFWLRAIARGFVSIHNPVR